MHMPDTERKIKFLRIVFLRVKNSLTRQTVANLLMALFIILSTIGAFLIYLPAGFIAAGLACGLLGLLLGLE